jgi:integrase
MKNPADRCTLPSVPDHRDIIAWTSAQVAAFLTDAKEPSVYGFYVAAIATGCRPSELLGASEDAIDFDRGVLRVRTTLVQAGRAPTYSTPKTRAGVRDVPLPPEAATAIRMALVWRKEQKLRLRPKFVDGGTCFCTERGRPINRRVLLARDFRPRLRRLGLKGRLYDLRHLHVSFLVASGVDLRTVADRAGHTDPGYLIRRYAHAVASAQERATAVASNLLAKSGVSER